MKATLRKSDLLYPELSYKIIGCCFEVFKALGPGLLEKDYQKALRLSLLKAGLVIEEQVKHNITFDGVKISTGFFDFVVEKKIVLELKRGKFYLSGEFQQLLRYLKMSDYELGIVIRFGEQGVEYKRVLNIKSEPMT